MRNRTIYTIDVILIAGTLLTLLWGVGYVKPLVIAPIDGEITSNDSILFKFEKANLILIDDNLEFSSPEEIYVKDNLIVRLSPGVYYWKVAGAVESSVRKLEILSNVDLQIRENKEGYELINAGNVRLSVDVYENESLREERKIEVGGMENSSGEVFIGGQDE